SCVRSRGSVKWKGSALALPIGKAGRAVRVFVQQVPAGSVAGGHSYGGRVASMAATEVDYAALVLLSYPLHRPGHPEDLRTAHWSKITCPVLFLSGESAPFARIELLKSSVRKLPGAELVTFPGLGQGCLPVVGRARRRVAAFVRQLRP